MRAAFLGAWLLAATAVAWPVDFSVSVSLEDPYMHRLSALDWIDVEDPSVVEVEILPSGDLLFTGKKAGTTHLLLGAQGKFAVWRVFVGGARAQTGPTAEQRALLTKTCPGAKVEAGALEVQVKDARCREALLEVLKTDAFRARELELDFPIEVLQLQLGAIQAAVQRELTGKVQLVYAGAGLVARGELTAEEHKKLLWTLFRNSAGRVALEDRVKVTAPPAPPKDETER